MVYFWIAFYSDNTCLPQFDFETGVMNPFKSIDQTKLEKFGLFPLNEALATKVNAVNPNAVMVRPNLPYFMMVLAKDQRLIYVRRNYIHTFSYLRCLKCGYEYQWMPTKTVQESEFGMMMHPDHIVQRYQGKDRPIPKCPKCGSFLPILCPDCCSLVARFKRDNSNETFMKCEHCGKEYLKVLEERENCVRRMIYLLGWQKTEGGLNTKHIMFINEDGSFEINEDFNYK